MKYIADFHIHSHYSIATSKKLIPEYLDYWARLKGINVIGTGDCVHPGWLKELKEKLEPASNGLYRLRDEFRLKDILTSSGSIKLKDIYFILTGEISNIYKKDGSVRKVHNLTIFPNFEAVEFVQKRLTKIGNIESDGRPILGLDSKILLEMILESSHNSFLIPAHIWTPWFSVLGSKSGFESVNECYEDLTSHIFAVETGLSSDPTMNWTCSFLDKFKLVSNSDAHSPEKLGREANLFDAELSYEGIYESLSGDTGLFGTIEFFPEEGKYHYDGHRKCNIRWDPLETLLNDSLCPVCGKPVTKGVMHRVAELADRFNLKNSDNKNYYYSITSLSDLLAEMLGKKNSSTKTVQNEYFRLIRELGPELNILLFADNNEIREQGGELLAEGVQRLRDGKIIIDEGFDGEYGRIKVFTEEEIASFSGKHLFLTVSQNPKDRRIKSKLSLDFNIEEFQSLYQKSSTNNEIQRNNLSENIFNKDQRDGIEHLFGPCMVLAGPGSGKTRILTERIQQLITHHSVKQENILSVTFSNKAAKEMRERLIKRLSPLRVNISTFHSFGLSILREHCKKLDRTERFYIIDDNEKREILLKIEGVNKRGIEKKIEQIMAFKQGILLEDAYGILGVYQSELKLRGAFDLDDLIYLPVELLKMNPDILKLYRERYPWILIDEYQDINARQYELITLIAGEGNPNLFVIGDPDQSIYGFRGSDIRFIDRIKKDLPNIRVIGLTKSYRCPDSIIKIAAQVLQKGKFMQGKPDDIKVHIQETETEKSEADWIATQIERMMGGVRSFSMDSGISNGEASSDSGSFSDFCILCRSTSMFDPIVRALENHGIAYQVIGTEPFYMKEPFNSLIGQFRRIYFHQKDIEPSISQIDIEEILQMIDNREEVYKTVYLMMKGIVFDAEDIERIMLLAKPFGNDYDSFFFNLSTRKGIDEYDERTEAVSLMTIHASKGLEFNTVFIPGCEDRIIPFELFEKKGARELHEEERIFYVGITRTRKYLFLTHAKRRYYSGRFLNQQRSRFINRLEKELLHQEKRESKTSVSDEIQLDLF
ncbi:MAG: UvrD-helicase domain-containing protein [Spirochaetota bacterium]|nr:UvrD-helicase domain-containing protein [Spirochaetota bacterium]